MEECTEGETEAAHGEGGRELERMFERNMATRVSERLERSAICKNNLSNYEESRLASPSDMFYCTPIWLTRCSCTRMCCIYLDAAVYCF